MRVAFVVSGLEPTRFTGGILCILEHANGLVGRGHDVVVVSIGPNHRPEWIDLRAGLVDRHEPTLPRALANIVRVAAARRVGRSSPERAEIAARDVVRHLAPHAGELWLRASHFDQLRAVAPEADVTVATDVTTAIPTHLYGRGRKAYFMQHYEPLTVSQFADQALTGGEAELSVRLPLHKLANSSWNARMIEENTGHRAPVCLNAIDHGVFFPDGEPPGDDFVVVSYGGRKAPWKGFREAAQAIRLARRAVPNLRWRVYGGALLPPDNDVAPYEDLGFVAGVDLRRLYSSAHVVLCPSWYESFPLFPIEAMACGSAVVTTPYGTEDYARDGVNALVVPPREPEPMARAVVALARDEERRRRLAAQGAQDARAFTWDAASEGMERALREIVATP